ncbi:ribonuclease H-like domain-containing protein, partial [Tanacetum coccineum]
MCGNLTAIGTKWILNNKRDARGIVVRNKARLVAQGHRQEEGIDYDEVFAPVARIEAIILFLAFSSYMGFMVFQMDVKSAFLYGEIDEEVYVTQPKGFEDPFYPKHVRGLQVKQNPDGIFISQDKYVQDMLKKFDMESVRPATTPFEASKPKSKDEPDNAVNVHSYRSMIGSLMYLPLTSNLNAVKKIFKYLKGQPKLGLWYPRDSPFVLEAYSDSDYAGSHGDRKSTTGGCQFLGRRLEDLSRAGPTTRLFMIAIRSSKETEDVFLLSIEESIAESLFFRSFLRFRALNCLP